MKQLTLALLVWLFVAGGAAAGDHSAGHRRTDDPPTEVEGLSASGTVEYHPNGALMFARIANETVLSGHTFPEGTGLHFREDGTIDWCFLAKESRLQGYLFQGGGHQWMTEFYPSGKMKSGGLAEAQVIDGIPCAAGTFWSEVFGRGARTYFYESGRLQYARVARTVQYRGTRIQKGKHVRLSEDGAILAVE